MTKKAISNPIEPNLFGFVCVIPAQAGIQVLLLEAGSWPLEAVLQNEAILKTEKTLISRQKQRKGGQTKG